VIVGSAIAVLSLVSFAAGACGWIRREANPIERAGAVICGAILVSGGGVLGWLGATGFASIVGAHLFRTRMPAEQATKARKTTSHENAKTRNP
jgi:hypothetical protein